MDSREPPPPPSSPPQPREPSPWQATLARMLDRLPPQWRTRRGALVASTALIGVLVIALVVRSSHQRPPEQPAPGTRIFFVSGRPTVVFAHSVGHVHITGGADGQVEIKENRNGATDEIHIGYVQHGDTITVTTDIPRGLFIDTWVDFDVQVPARSGLDARMATGTLDANGLSGQIALHDTDGSIWANGLDGAITMTTTSGSINTNHVRGQITATTQNGTITTLDTLLRGRATIQAESGTINFHGALDRNGTYVFRNGNGAVGLTLPRAAAFALDARTGGGSINSDFAGVKVAHHSATTTGSGTVGSAPRARLAIQTTGGSIALFQGG